MMPHFELDVKFNLLLCFIVVWRYSSDDTHWALSCEHLFSDAWTHAAMNKKIK